MSIWKRIFGVTDPESKTKKCPHSFTIEDADPRALCPFCPQPNRAKIVKAWEESRGQGSRRV